MQADVSIARLRIATGPGVRGGLVTARALVEDALRTVASAAGPAAARGLLVLRRLDAGRVRADPDRRAAQRRVGGALADAARRAVHPLDPRAAEADAVLFREPLEAYALYAEALFRGARLRDAWFFRAVFGGGRNLAVTEAGRRLLLRAAGEPFAPLAVAEVILRAGSFAGPLAASLSPAEATSMLGRIATAEGPHGGRAESAAGRDSPEPAEMPESVASDLLALLPPRLRAVACGVVERFGCDDPRAQLVIAATLIEASAAPLSRGLVALVTRAIARCAAAAARLDEAKPGSPVRLVVKDLVGLQPDAAASNGARASASPPPPEGTARPAEGRPAEPAAASVEANGSPPPYRQEPPDRQRRSARPAENPDRPGPTARAADPPVPGAERIEEDRVASRDHDAAVPATAPPPAIEPLPWDEPTAWAGAVLVASAVARALGPLVASPDAMDADLGRCLLGRMLGRAGCAARDPARGAFGPAARARRAAGPLAFHLPAAFALFGAGDLTLHRLEGRPGWRALTCRRGRVILALWTGRAPPPVRRRAAGATIARGPALADDPMPAVLTTAELTLRAWLRRATGYRIGEVLGRSGWVRATRSHLDVTFDSGLVDLAIRRAGLDLNAGWCPWLFRVVTVHYDYGGPDA